MHKFISFYKETYYKSTYNMYYQTRLSNILAGGYSERHFILRIWMKYYVQLR